MKSFLVIGLGRFGRHLAKKLMEFGNDVMVVDKSEDVIEGMASEFTDSYIGDCCNEGVLRALGVQHYDVCFVTVDQDFQASLEITSMLKELGARHVVSNANRDRQAAFLKKIGADDVIYPEREIAEKTAVKYNANNVFDYIELTEEYSLYELPIHKAWEGKTIGNVDVRNQYRVNIIAIIQDEKLDPVPKSSYVFREDDHIVVIGTDEDIKRFTEED
ncbi:MAG: TrkA family potassium uptake protein [Clostridia bacterium]|nr:TrkA family potassium uptake protein [Clostridia bacterium]